MLCAVTKMGRFCWMLGMLLTTRILAVFEWLREGDPQALIAEGKVDGEGMLSRGYTRVEILQRGE